MSDAPETWPAIRATYRLQFSRDFTFRDAATLVPYLAKLGVSHIYASPITEARPGSTHGYDIVDHNRLNPEIGSDIEFKALIAALRHHEMGLIVDFVPNHVGIGADNAWWLDLLEWGRASPFADYFDINWDGVRPDLDGRVLLPVLGEQYGVALENGEIELRFGREDGSFSAWYYEHRFPIAPRSYPMILEAGGERLAAFARGFSAIETREDAARLKRELAAFAATPSGEAIIAAALRQFAGRPGEPDSFEPLHRLLDMQHYRVAYWRVAAEEINYRRFFNINDLAALRMELPELFRHTHEMVFAMIAAGDLQGLRVDHIDGLFDPREYCERLQRASPAPLYVLAEKILAAYEMLPAWPVAGTTGYDFVNQALALFVDAAGERAITRFYRRFTGRDESFDEVLYASKMRIMRVNLASEMNVLAREFHRISMRERRTRDFTLNGMRAALEEVIAAFPVYRTYVTAAGAGNDDRRYIDWAMAQAKKRWRGAEVSIFDFIRGILMAEAEERTAEASEEIRRVAMHFQQVTGPVMAKAAEDTAFYRYVRLLALNEVGGDPRRFGISVAAFHHMMRERARLWPHAMVTTATHDTKRGEDGRIRIALLSEMPREWARRLAQWTRLNRSRRSEIDGETTPGRNLEYLFYQSLLGAWPPDLSPDDQDAMQNLRERFEEYIVKAAREAKEETSWSNPNAVYEAALTRFVSTVLDAARPNPFLTEFHAFVETLARPAAIASLSQLVLKLTAPGVPDIYQGGELWDFNLVDPDNRRPVDWACRRAILDVGDALTPGDVAQNWRQGWEKLFVTRRLLELRRALPDLFAAGDYRPLDVSGDRSQHICAFARAGGEVAIAVAAPRLVWGLYRQGGPAADWGDAEIALPAASNGWRDVFSARRLTPSERIRAGEWLADFPVGVLVSDTG
jgi:(1->4)-alpha-D-glucan 1-alpha-D-glucosylmutase